MVKRIVEYTRKIISNLQDVPFFLPQVITYLIPKDHNNTQDPAKYKPKTSLSTFYKVVMSDSLHLSTQNNIITPQ